MLEFLGKLDAMERRMDKLLPEPKPAEDPSSQSVVDCTGSILDFIQGISPEFERPDWFEPYTTALESSLLGAIYICFAAPPQHGKTETTLRGLLWLCLREPGKRHAYLTYNDERAREVSDIFAGILQSAGIPYSGNQHLIKIGASRIKFGSIYGAVTGFAITGVCIVDDPIAGPEDAMSPTKRRKLRDFFTSVIWTRRHKSTSFIVMATRWHVEDLTGHLVQKMGWRYINLKCIADGPTNDNGRVVDDPLGRQQGESLWPSKKPPEFFADERKNAYFWAALYQGEPRPLGGAVFKDPEFYDRIPEGGFSVGYGVDLAYTAKTQADRSVALRGRKVGNVYYVTFGMRRQVEATAFCGDLKRIHTEEPGPMLWYGSGTEKGVSQFIQKQIPQLRFKQTTSDKFIRAQPVSAAYNDRRVLWPSNKAVGYGEWTQESIDVVSGFTGQNDLIDDDVDALAAMFDVLSTGAAKYDPKFDKFLPDLRI